MMPERDSETSIFGNFYLPVEARRCCSWAPLSPKPVAMPGSSTLSVITRQGPSVLGCPDLVMKFSWGQLISMVTCKKDVHPKKGTASRGIARYRSIASHNPS